MRNILLSEKSSKYAGDGYVSRKRFYPSKENSSCRTACFGSFPSFVHWKSWFHPRIFSGCYYFLLAVQYYTKDIDLDVASTLPPILLSTAYASTAKPIRTRTRQTDFVFFRPWHFSAFHLCQCNFPDTHWSDSSNFCINTTFTIYHIQNFRRLKFFRRVISDKKFNLRIFLKGEEYIFESCLYRKLRNVGDFALIDVTSLVERCAVICFAKEKFGHFPSKKSGNL